MARLGDGLRVELGGRGVEVLVTAPGPTTTGFAARVRLTGQVMRGMAQTA